MSRMGVVVSFKHHLEDLSDFDFISKIYWLTNAKKERFKNVVKSTSRYDDLYDIKAEEILGDGKSVTAVFQMKRANLLTPDAIQFTSGYWFSMKDPKPEKFYIFTDGDVTRDAVDLADKLGIEIWDIYALHKLSNPKFYEEVKKPEPQPETKEENLSQALRELRPGRDEWTTYQQLVSDIFSHLFCPPLELPRYEHSDAEERNRRDMIFENSNNHPYWKMLRQIYRADYIVVDAKNYSTPIEKQPILDLSHYLKPRGCGMFGIIATRIGESEASKHAVKEQWVSGEKMIIVLNDADLLDMLAMKAVGSNPEELIKTKIADFRMSL